MGGASCLVFILPSFVMGYLALTAQATYCTLGAPILAAFLCYVSTISFFADYWYTGDSEPENPNEGIPDYQKQICFNSIDVINVPLIALTWISLGGIQMCYARAMNWAYPVLFLVFCCAGYLQKVSLTYLKKYTDIKHRADYDETNPPPEAGKALKTGLMLHTTWHFLAVIPPLVQMYGLMMY